MHNHNHMGLLTSFPFFCGKSRSGVFIVIQPHAFLRIYLQITSNHRQPPHNSELMNRAHTVSKPASHIYYRAHIAQLNLCVVDFTHMRAKGMP